MKNRLLLCAAALLLVITLGCGGGSSNNSSAPVTYNKSALKGQYTISMNTLISQASVGTFTADGNGNISNGSIDSNVNGTYTTQSFTGTYDIDDTGAGTATLNVAGTPMHFSISASSTDEFSFVQTDSTNPTSGTIQKQATTNTSNASLNGSYAFNLSDSLFGVAGRFSADGAGHISGGSMDYNMFLFGTRPTSPEISRAMKSSQMLNKKVNAQLYGTRQSITQGTSSAAVTFTGTYSIGSNGTGTLTFAFDGGDSSTFKVYVLADGTLKILGTDMGASGSVAKQPSTISNASLNGAFVMNALGIDYDSTNDNLYLASSLVRFTADGNGNITAGTLEQNANGTMTAAVNFTGTYSIDNTGRGTVTLNLPNSATSSMVIYLMGDKVMVISQSQNSLFTGTAYKQTANVTTSTLKGRFNTGYLQADDSELVNAIGVLNLDGAGKIDGKQQIYVQDFSNETGALQQDVATTGTYAVDSNGHGTATVTGGTGSNAFGVNLKFFAVDANHVVFISGDTATGSTSVGFGEFVKQK